jgi:hypothetical protein
MEKYCKTGKATDENNAHAHFMLDTKGDTHTHTHSEYMILLPFPNNDGCTNAPQCYAIRRVRLVKFYFRCYIQLQVSFKTREMLACTKTLPHHSPELTN